MPSERAGQVRRSKSSSNAPKRLCRKQSRSGGVEDHGTRDTGAELTQRFALVSDVHSNVEALAAVFKDIAARNIPRTYCLGDVVGYGPEPDVTSDMIREKCKDTIRGNHD